MNRKKQRRKKACKSNTKLSNIGRTVIAPEYYQLVWARLHVKFNDLLHTRYVTDTIELRRSLVTKFREKIVDLDQDSQYSGLLELLQQIEGEMRGVAQRRPAFYWLHIYRRLAPGLSNELGDRADAITLLEVRAFVEQAIFKYGSLSDMSGISLSTKVEPAQILGGMMSSMLREAFGATKAAQYERMLTKTPQWILTDFSEQDIADVYHLEGLAYQYWYVATKLRARGKGVRIDCTPNGDLREARTTEQDRLIVSFDTRGERASIKMGFGSNVGTFVRSEFANPYDAIFCATLNVEGYNAHDLGLTGISEDYAPNYLPFTFDAEAYFDSHSYLAPYFEKMTGFGLLEFCQIATICSQLLITALHPNINSIENMSLIFYSKMQRAYLFYGKSLEDLKQDIVTSISERRSHGRMRQSNAEQQVDRVIDFLTLNEKKQSLVGLWSFGPRFAIVKCGENYFCDYSAWFVIFQNLFFGLKNYDPNSQKGPQFEYTFGDLARSNSFDVIMQSTKIKVNGLEREIDVAIRIKDSLFLFECRAFERPLDFLIGKPKTISIRTEDMNDKLSQVTTLVDFVQLNRAGDNYDFTWAESIHGSVVSPYTEWIWSLNEHLWTETPTFPKIMSPTEALEYLQNWKQRTETSLQVH